MAPVSDITETDGAGGSKEPDPAFSFGIAPVVGTWPLDSMFKTPESVNSFLLFSVYQTFRERSRVSQTAGMNFQVNRNQDKKWLKEDVIPIVLLLQCWKNARSHFAGGNDVIFVILQAIQRMCSAEKVCMTTLLAQELQYFVVELFNRIN